MPQSPEYELALLCSLILQPEILDSPDFKVVEADFHIPAHAEVFELLKTLWAAEEPIDANSITRALRDARRLDQVGGVPFLNRLFEATSSSADWQRSARILREKLISRMRQSLGRLYAQVQDFDLPIEILNLQKEIAEMEADTRPRPSIMDQWSALRFDPSKPPAAARVVFTLNGKPWSTNGNLSGLAGHIKSGKSGSMSGLLAATLPGDGDTLGFDSQNDRGQAVIHLDTEQSDNDHHRLLVNSLRRKGYATCPNWLLSFRITSVPTAKRLVELEALMREASTKFKGIHSVLIDGVADLMVRGPNDEQESIELVQKLQQLAIEYDTHIVAVLHWNPSKDFQKTRGHLGSQLERKAETNLALEMDDNNVTTIYCKTARSTHIPKSEGQRFRWSDEDGMHMSCDADTTVSPDRVFLLKALADQVFEGSKCLRYLDAVSAIGLAKGIGKHQATNLFTEINKGGFIKKNPLNKWELAA